MKCFTGATLTLHAHERTNAGELSGDVRHGANDISHTSFRRNSVTK